MKAIKNPLRKGKNRLRIDAKVLRRDRPILKPSWLTLRPSKSESESGTPFDLEEMIVEHPSASCELEIEIDSQGRVSSLRRTFRGWWDVESSRQAVEETAWTTLDAAADRHGVNLWTRKGVLWVEEAHEKGRQICGTYRSPNGEPLASVVEGKGLRKRVRENGLPVAETPIDNGLPDGLAKHFDDAGRLIGETTYRKGVLDGPFRVLDEKGCVTMTGAYQAGEKHGVWTRLGEDGKESARSIFDKGKLVEGSDLFEE